MYNKLLLLTKNKFVRNVAVVATGTAAAQFVSMLFSPVITRIYGPESMGILGVFLAMVQFITPVAALTYPMAIVLPSNHTEARGIMRLSLYISAIIAGLASIILLLFNEEIVSIFNIESISSYLYLIPILIFFSALQQVTEQWLIRIKEFKVTAKVVFTKTLLLNSARVAIGLVNPIAAVLVILTVVGNAIHALMLQIGSRKTTKKLVHDDIRQNLNKILLLKYKDFAIFRSPRTFLNAISQNLPILLLASYFGPVSAGFYSLGKTVLGLPISLIGKSVADVFYPRISEASYKGEDLSKLISKATIALFLVGIIPFGIIVLYGPSIFGFVFGEEWIKAGEYARWLSLGIFIEFINRPSIKAIPVLKLQGTLLLYEVISIVFLSGMLFIGFNYFNSDIYGIIFFSVAIIFLNISLILFVIWKSKNYYKKNNVKKFMKFCT